MNIELAAESPESTLFAVPSRRTQFRTMSAWMFWAIIVINAVVIIWLWVYGKNISGVHGWGDLWTSIGRLTGLLSAYLALVQVLLLARLPWLERVLGFDR